MRQPDDADIAKLKVVLDALLVTQYALEDARVQFERKHTDLQFAFEDAKTAFERAREQMRMDCRVPSEAILDHSSGIFMENTPTGLVPVKVK